MKERDMLIWLNNLPGINNRYLEYLDRNIDLLNIWQMDSAEIYSLPIGEKLKQSIIENRNRVFYDDIIEKAFKKSINIVTIRDEDYPLNLYNIPDAPRVLYVKGSLHLKDKWSISIVGPRKASSYGLWAANSLSDELSKLGITVVSGMALGVDATAHLAAIKNKSRTLAVLGTGPDVVYPAANRHIYESIVNLGAVISEYPLETKALPYRFPQRNRIISGISLGTVVIEAAEKSGTLTTVTHGLDQGREIFALPGNINSFYSKGTNMLIKEGAKLVQSIDDILSEISELKCIKREEKNDYKKENLSKVEKAILDHLRRGPSHLEEIAIVINETIPKTISTLTVLELKSQIKKSKSNIWILN